MLVFSRIAHDLAGIVMEQIFRGGELHRFLKHTRDVSLQNGLFEEILFSFLIFLKYL